MSYRLVNSNELAIKYPEVNDMPCIYADLPNGLDNGYYVLSSGHKKDEIEDAFLTVGIMIRAKINELCNDKKFTEAKEIEQAYDIINKYFDDKLQWREIKNE